MYDYQVERPKLFTEEGQVWLLAVRDEVAQLLAKTGALRGDKLQLRRGDSWATLACLDRLVELGELERLRPENFRAQYQVYTRPLTEKFLEEGE